jgi:hypothetical protein
MEVGSLSRERQAGSRNLDIQQKASFVVYALLALFDVSFPMAASLHTLCFP